MKNYYKKVFTNVLNIYTVLGVLILIVATVFILSPLYPYIWFQLNNDALASEQTNVETLVENIKEEDKVKNTNTLGIPKKDSSLSNVNKLIIPSIGINGNINENINSARGLEKGIWRVSEWGDPLNNTNSIILASHRFGYLTWSRDFRKKNSFENLPKTKVGDKIEIIWDQRKFVYEIYKSQEGVKITEYKADLILYTCKTLNSEIRIFRYAKRVE